MLTVFLKKKKVSNDFLYASFQFEDKLLESNHDFMRPGEFLMLKNRTEPILAKPFSVLDTNKSGFDVLIKIVGRFTNYLSQALVGEPFYFRGPYGTAFEKKIDMSTKIITIGGGCGAAPILFFNNRFPDTIEKSIIGFKDEQIKEVIEIDEACYESLSGRTVIDELDDYFSYRKTNQSPVVLACGSIGMCKALHKHSMQWDYQLFVSLDERMGCGMGMCKGCPVKTKSGIKMVCKDGPIFRSDEIIWEW
ncbi:MAG: FAD-binding oxidoreductase [Bacteroidota bacterium]